jgi:phosphotransferase system HPr (HPr) family protein
MGFGPLSTPSACDRPRESQVFIPNRAGAFAKILVVDDDRDTAESMATLLGLFGHDVRIALDGHRAIEVARLRRPDCVLLDVGLPGLDGYEVASWLRRELGGSVVLIAVTGYGREEDHRAALAAGFDHHFVKPLDQDGLNALLAALDAGARSGPTAPVAELAAADGEATPTTDSSARERGDPRVGGDLPIGDILPREASGREGCPSPTVRRRVEVTNPLGLHLRIAAAIVRRAQQFRAEVRVGCDGREASARSALDLTTLAAGRGSRLDLRAEGPEAEAAVEALIDLIGSGSDEPGR